MTEKKVKPRSLSRYSDAVKAGARKAFLEFSFIDKHYRESQFGKAVTAGGADELPMVQLAAFMLDSQRPAGVMCTGCGSNWTDERLAEEKAKRPKLRSCCPERKMMPVYWCLGAGV